MKENENILVIENLPTATLVSCLQELTKDTTGLNFRNIPFMLKTNDEISAIFKAIPQWIKSLVLEHVLWPNNSRETLKAAFSCLPPLTHLKLSHHFNKNTFEDLFEVLPKTIEVLELNIDNLFITDLDQCLLKLCYLKDLNINVGGAIIDDTIEAIMNSLPVTLTQFTIKGKKIGSALQSIITLLPANVSELAVLSEGPIGYTILLESFERLPENLKQLTLNSDNFSDVISADKEHLKFDLETVERLGKASKYFTLLRCPQDSLVPGIICLNDMVRIHMGTWVLQAHEEVEQALLKNNNTNASSNIALEIMSFFTPEDINIKSALSLLKQERSPEKMNFYTAIQSIENRKKLERANKESVTFGTESKETPTLSPALFLNPLRGCLL